MEDHKKEAQKWLERLRSGTSYWESFLQYLRNNLQKAGLTLKDIGTSEKELEKLRIKGCKTSAQKWLEYLRSGTDQYESFLRYLLEEVKEGGFTLKDIGTSEEELKKLRVKGCKISAQKWLEYLRSGTDQYESFLRYLLEEVKEGGFTLKDIGTSEEELKKLRVKGCKISAQNCLEDLRSGTEYYKSSLEDLHSDLRDGGLTLKDIGTSEEELENLRVKGCKISAQNWLKDLRSGTDLYESFLECLRSDLQNGGFTLEDIGTSEEELEKLRPVTVKK